MPTPSRWTSWSAIPRCRFRRTSGSRRSSSRSIGRTLPTARSANGWWIWTKGSRNGATATSRWCSGRSAPRSAPEALPAPSIWRARCSGRCFRTSGVSGRRCSRPRFVADHLRGEALHLLGLRAELQQQEVDARGRELLDPLAHLLGCADEPGAQPPVGDRVLLQGHAPLELRSGEPLLV